MKKYVPPPLPEGFHVGTWVRFMDNCGDFYDGKHYVVPFGQVGQIYEIDEDRIHVKLFKPVGRPTLCTARCDVESFWRITKNPTTEPWVLGPYTRFDHEAPL